MQKNYPIMYDLTDKEIKKNNKTTELILVRQSFPIIYIQS